MEKRRERLEAQEEKMARRQRVIEMKRRQGGGGGQILLAYGLNKNLKNQIKYLERYTWRPNYRHFQDD